MEAMLWDVFCKVIDNFGDIGVCWRLSTALADRGEFVRLWVDDLSALQWMAPTGHKHVQCLQWSDPPLITEPGDVVLEAFGCDPPDAFVAALALKTKREGRQPPWINLEYLSAEPYAERSHGLPSPVTAGPGAGLTKHFFFPGFTAKTGGLLRESWLTQRHVRHDRAGWLARQGVHPKPDTRVVSLFCYATAAVPALLSWLARGPQHTTLMVTAGHASDLMRRHLPGIHHHGKLDLHYLPLLSQEDYDKLLWSCDFNFVRGEDSLVRAIWAGRPFVWQAYPQDEQAQSTKLEAFLDWLGAKESLRIYHRVWNGLSVATLPAPDLAGWGATAELARLRALSLPDLAERLQQHVNRAATM